MTSIVSKEQALQAHAFVYAEHGNKDYFIEAEVVSHDIGWAVDLRVDRLKWAAAGMTGKAPHHFYRVPICTLLYG